ncbi:indolepyruvate oxidoreductase subunit beta family protein [Novosphingobium sp. 1949]|uniref:Indolepyruvate oxidoreductase subunit beta family protein n=1 Tax=Novosphingobium organovorum TaxID=2930092 RepID=A0ABT0BBZ6_9SPHN|nr:indolepyruvate oxidoreductase subunit beta family protein [Novosphingobium organovorum]MCJ2182430.1 indolepyruvate oxidoreductase subunit beta family protein [Novosphingobium organovorum]
MSENRNRITIAILALGGQGGGVLADWIQEVGRQEGWLAQGTSIAGVAQRTGSTVYYVELARPDASGRLPVMAQMPMPGDVDIVLASELMETGRALLRGFSTAERTTLIGSTHRIYAIGEKMAMGDGRGNGDKIIAAAHERSRRFIGFDMEAATDRSGSVISSIMFGALAGSGALPFPTETFRSVIEKSGIAVTSNFRGFAEGFDAAQKPVAKPVEIAHAVPVATTEKGRELEARVRAELPAAAQENALHGVARLMDYQSGDYAALYIDRLVSLARMDAQPFDLTAEAARHVALWMSYEDTVRVADLKTRAARVERVRDEVKAQDDQVLSVTEFMHPRMQEICEMLPAGLARKLLRSGVAKAFFARFFNTGRHVETTSLRWFLMLRMVARMQALRPRSLRYLEEQERIEGWLSLVHEAVGNGDRALALELVRCQRLIKGYGDTFERGLRNYSAIIALHTSRRQTAAEVRNLRDLALSDETCNALDKAIAAAG